MSGDGHHAGEPQTSSPNPPQLQQASAGKRAREKDVVSTCNLFKIQLSAYTQKAGIGKPIYETTREGPTREGRIYKPIFRSTVIVNGIRYSSLDGFRDRKPAEQSAAQIALMELERLGEVNGGLSQSVIETELCKDLLHNYAAKMHYHNPSYQLKRFETLLGERGYKCTVVVGGKKYTGTAARNRKEAEINAARKAWLDIKKSSSELSDRSTENSMPTVSPSRKRVLEARSVPNETTNTTPLAKKTRKEPSSEEEEAAQHMEVSISTHDRSEEAGCSWITAQKKVHVFKANDTSHERNSDIQKMLVKLKGDIEAAGCIPDTTHAPHDQGDDYEENSKDLWQHSEKIALAFGLISIPPGLPISIHSNQRICGDCHNYFSCISSIIRRQILVTNMNMVHQFWNGRCSCNNRW